VENAKALQASSGVCEMSPEVKVLSPVWEGGKGRAHLFLPVSAS
jgi:hypothetical protein